MQPSLPAASSSGIAQPVAPPLLPPIFEPIDDASQVGSSRAPARRGERLKALDSIAVEGGRISFYKDGRFEAVCSNPAHGKCVATRSCKVVKWSPTGVPLGGRPCGWMAAWLSAGVALNTREEHRSSDVENIPYDLRALGRTILQLEPAGADLLLRERQCHKDLGEESEPETLDGLIKRRS